MLSPLCFIQTSVVRAFPGTARPTNPEKARKYFSGHSSLLNQFTGEFVLRVRGTARAGHPV